MHFQKIINQIGLYVNKKSTKYVENVAFYPNKHPNTLLFYDIASFNLSNMSVKGIFGKNLKYYRKEKKLSQEELSENVDITVKHLSEIERGIVFASASLIEKLAENLDIPIFALFLIDDSIYYNNIMLARIEKTIIENIECTMDNIKKGIFDKPFSR